MSGEPKTLTPEEALRLLRERGMELTFDSNDATPWAVYRDNGEYLNEYLHFGQSEEEVLSAALGVRVVARDEAAELKPIGWDDVTDEDVMAALVTAQTEANVLKRAVREWVEADAAYSEWMVLPVREDWTSGEAKARKERLESAEAVLRRLAGGESEK